MNYKDKTIHYYPQDYVLKYTLIPIIPDFVSPNILTILRYVMTPIVILFLVFENYKFGIPLFVFAAFTDMLDGSLARIRKEITRWGIINDPIADKLLIGSVLLIFAIKYINIYILILMIFLEILTLLSAYVLGSMKKVDAIPANIFGKIKMSLQVLGLALLMLNLYVKHDLLQNFATIIFLISLIFSLLSFVYFRVKYKQKFYSI